MVAATKNHKNYSLKCRRNQELTGLPSKMSEYHGADIANASLPASVHGTFHVQVPDLWTIGSLQNSCHQKRSLVMCQCSLKSISCYQAMLIVEQKFIKENRKSVVAKAICSGLKASFSQKGNSL
jgi:hypothetical protein